MVINTVAVAAPTLPYIVNDTRDGKIVSQTTPEVINITDGNDDIANQATSLLQSIQNWEAIGISGWVMGKITLQVLS